MLRMGLAGFALLMCPIAALAQYQANRVQGFPQEIPPAVARLLDKDGFRISRGADRYCEIWFRRELPKPAGEQSKNAPSNVTLAQIPLGSLVGAIRFEAPGEDRLGHPVAPGVYTLRYAWMPSDDDHLGAAPHRDFLLLGPVAEDRNPGGILALEELIALARQASDGQHPAVLSISKATSEAAGFGQQGDDWILNTSVGDTAIAVILAAEAAR